MSPNKQFVEAYDFGPFRLDLVVRQLFHRDNPIPLSSRTFDILNILLENKGQVVTKKELISQVWPNHFVEENNLAVRMAGLRKVLGESSENRFIETVPGYGYRFVGRVRETFGKHRMLQTEVYDSIAVLPLINENNTQRFDYLCDGITESLISSLSNISNLRVMARNTVFHYKTRETNIQKAGKELGVQAVLVGNVNQISNSVILNIEMIDVKDGAYLWGAKFNHQFSDLVTLQEDIAREVSEQLRIKLDKVEERQIAKRYTDNPQAYHLYMKGRYFWNMRSVPGVKRAIKYFKSAIRQDPKYSLAFAGLADSYILLSSSGLEPPRKTMPKARAAALKALAIDNQLAEAHVSLGNVQSSFELDWAGAESEFQMAIELNPYYAPARQFYAIFLAKVGRLDQALAEIGKAHEIDPLSPAINLAMGKIYYLLRRYKEVVRKGHEILEIDPKFSLANGLMGIAYLEMRRYKEAIKEFQTVIDYTAGGYKIKQAGEKLKLLDSDPESIALLGCAYAISGKRNKAFQLLDELLKQIKGSYVEPHALAFLYIGLGDTDKAFEWLEKAFENKSESVTYIKVWPLFHHLRGDPRYEEMVRRLRFPD